MVSASVFKILLYILPVSASALYSHDAEVRRHHARTLNGTCAQLAAAVSSASNVYWPLSLQYIEDTEHYMTSSSDSSICSVEPGNPQDVSTIIKILAANQTPYGVKGGGHASNADFSSTPGVQISMTRFNQVTYSASAGTVEIGTGLIWDDVYGALEQYNVNIVGGRVSGVGVAGFTLGGGYSWKTSQHGLTVDTATAFNLVLPNGTVTTVTATSTPDLFWGLKGGFNNFGIVTSFVLKAFPQTQVWGGLITYTANNLQAVNDATVKFQQQKDPKAQIISTYNFVLGEPGVSELLFYDGPTPPAGIFDDFLAIPAFTSGVETRSFTSLVQSAPSNATSGNRGLFHTVSVTNITDNIMAAVLNETTFWGERLSLIGGSFISYDVEPFQTDLFSHGVASAYPPDRSVGLLPINIYYVWSLESEDQTFHAAALASAAQLKAVAEADGQNITSAALYPNYAVAGTPLADIYGANVDSLHSLKLKYDPQNVTGLTGGWKF